jgi:hypothetical protein
MAGTFFGGSCQGLEQFVIPIPTISTTSRVQYVGNGVTKQYLITWPYISFTHVNVLVGGVIQGTNLWSFINGTTVQLNNPPANGLLVELRRVTPQSSLVTFTNGAVLTADDLNMAALQALFLIQEFNDLYGAGLNGALTQVAGYNGPVAVSPAEMIAAVADQVLQSSLVTSLNQRINDIDQNAVAIINNALAVDNINSIIDSLVGVGGVGTIIAAETASRISGDTALASQLTLLGAVNTLGTAFVLDTAHTYVDSTTSLATRLSGLDANFGTNAAAIVTEQTTRANADTSLASSITTLTTTVNGNTASIATNATTVSGLSAQYTVKVDVNGRVAGFGLASTVINAVPTSAFVVIANQFSIVDPGATGNTPIVPFIVTGGVVFMQNVVITNAVIQNAAITQAKIANLAVGTGQIIDNSSGQVVQFYDSTARAVFLEANVDSGGGVWNLKPLGPVQAAVTIVCSGTAPVAIDISLASLQGLFNLTPATWAGQFNVLKDGSLMSGAPQFNYDKTNCAIPASGSGNTTLAPFCFSLVDPTPTAGTHTYTLVGSCQVTGGAGIGRSFGFQTQYCSVKAREYKK